MAMIIDPDLCVILAGGFIMSLVAMVGSITVFLQPATLKRLLLPFISIAAGALFGGAYFHIIPEAQASLNSLVSGAWLVAGFTSFLAIEQFLHWHHSHKGEEAGRVQPSTYLILIGDAIHNFVGGLAISSTFLIDPHSGLIAWLAGLAHEIPQEVGDFGILVHGGWSRKRAICWNFISALTFPLGGLLAYVAEATFNVAALAMFGAGNFIYIAASDLIPDIKAETDWRTAALNFCLFVSGLLFTALMAFLFTTN